MVASMGEASERTNEATSERASIGAEVSGARAGEPTRWRILESLLSAQFSAIRDTRPPLPSDLNPRLLFRRLNVIEQVECGAGLPPLFLFTRSSHFLSVDFFRRHRDLSLIERNASHQIESLKAGTYLEAR